MSKVLIYVDKEAMHSNDNSAYIGEALQEEHEVLLSDKIPLDIDTFRGIFLRKDPPHDFYENTNLPRTIVKINDPLFMKRYGSKISLLDFKEHIPDSYVASSEENVLDLLKKYKKGVLKPPYSCKGKGITFVDRTTTPKELQTYFSNWGTSLFQEYLPEVSQGDKRIIVIDGEIISGVLRTSDQRICNLSAGGKLNKTRISQREKDISLIVGNILKERGQLIVGLDFIGEKLTEVNVSSPGLLRGIDVLYNNRNNYHAIQKLSCKYLK